MVRILLLGPNRWPKDTKDPEAGLKLRRRIVTDHADLDATWIIMEDELARGDPTDKFVALATDPSTTHVFLLWPRDARMVGTQDELILWQSIATLTGTAPECYLFHQTGVLHIETKGVDKQVVIDDEQGQSPYLYDILARGVFEQEWVDQNDLFVQIREVLVAHLGVQPKQ